MTVRLELNNAHDRKQVMPTSKPRQSLTFSVSNVVRQLEEISRLKAQLEAKVLEKQRRKAAATLPSLSSSNSVTPSLQAASEDQEGTRPEASQEVDRTMPENNPPLAQTRGAPITTTDDSITSPGPTITATMTTTPPVAGTPLISPGFQQTYYDPGFRTPSPPRRSRYDTSPSSGAYTRSSKKRQHSPSPLSRKTPLSAQGVRRPLTLPASAPRRLFVGQMGLTPEEVKTEACQQSTQLSQQPSTTTTTSVVDVPNEEDDFADLTFDDDFDILSPVKPTTRSSSHSERGPFSPVKPSPLRARRSSTIYDQEDPFNPVETTPTQDESPPSPDSDSDDPFNPSTTTDAHDLPPVGKGELLTSSIGPNNGGNRPLGRAASGTRLVHHEATTTSDIVDIDPLTGLRIL
jgi:hypothetical protein